MVVTNMIKEKKKLSEEHKKKIGDANRIKLKKFYEDHPDYRNSGMYKKGYISKRKGKPYLAIREENHYKWKGGTHATARRIAERYGFNLNKCSICEREGNMVVHHVDENPYNNNLENLRILCFQCHNQLHGMNIKTRFKKGHKVSKEVRKKISIANKGRKNRK